MACNNIPKTSLDVKRLNEDLPGLVGVEADRLGPLYPAKLIPAFTNGLESPKLFVPPSTVSPTAVCER